MQTSFKISGVALLSSFVLSCGILEPSPDSSAAPQMSSGSLPAPAVTPLFTNSGKLVATNRNTASASGSNSQNTENNTENPSQSLLAATPADMVKSVAQIFQTDRCNALSRGGFIWFTDEVVLNDWLSPLDAEEAKTIRSKIDFSKQGALLLDYGIAGSKGAGATIVDNMMEIKGQEAIVRIKQFNAPKNKKSVQVVTHPCSLFLMPRTGFSKLVILSDLNDKLTSFENK